jgi:molybdate transport system substrate-binding protein
MRAWSLLGLVVLAVAGCGANDEPPSSAGDTQLTVSAAASLKTAFTYYGRRFPDAAARFSFAGSDELAAQIRQGVKPDVYAAANTELPEQLFAEGLVEKPAVFAANELVLAVPAEDAEVASLADLEADGVDIAIGSRDVPVGSYARTVLERLPAARREAILANVRSEEPDVAGVTGKLTQGAVDAGFLYVSDVRATDGRLEAIALPDDLQPSIAFSVAVVKGAREPEAAKAFIAGLLDGPGAQALRDAGFEPPPGQ